MAGDLKNGERQEHKKRNEESPTENKRTETTGKTGKEKQITFPGKEKDMENHETALLDKAEVLDLQRKLIALGVLKKKDQFRLVSTLLHYIEEKEIYPEGKQNALENS